MSLKIEVAERSKELGLYDFMVELAKKFGAYDAVRLEVYQDNRWRFDMGYGVQVETERVIASYPVCYVETQTECLFIETPSGQRFVLSEQVSGGYVRFQRVWKLNG